MIFRIATFLGIILAQPVFGQNPPVPIEFDGQIRVRSEADGRDFNRDSDLNSYTLMRSRLGASIQPLDDVEVYLQIQDSRAFGQEPSTLANTSNLDIHQAYFRVSNLWNKPVELRLGRQELVYGAQRLIGSVGFSNVGRSFDGVKWTFGRESQLDIFGIILNESSAPVTGPATPATVAGRDDADNRFFGAYYEYRGNPDYKLDAYGLFESNVNQTVAGSNDLSRGTIGTYNRGRLSGSLDFETELALQFGKRLGEDVLAYMLTGSVGYTFSSVKKPSVRVGVDYLSGMDADDDKYKVFHTLFATNHKFYGFMDYFINIPVNSFGQGLQDLMVKATIPFAGKWILRANYHNFRAAKGSEKSFGNELDLIFNYRYNSAASFEFGFALFVPGKLLKGTFLSDDLGIWSYTSFLVNF